MGMFDWVSVEYKGIDWKIKRKVNADGWQTKDFENRLERYKITKEGVLLKFATSKWVETNYTGTLNFYNMEKGDVNGKSKLEWFEFTATFVNGQITEMERKENR